MRHFEVGFRRNPKIGEEEKWYPAMSTLKKFDEFVDYKGNVIKYRIIFVPLENNYSENSFSDVTSEFIECDETVKYEVKEDAIAPIADEGEGVK